MKKENRNLHRRVNDKASTARNLNGLGVVGMEKYVNSDPTDNFKEFKNMRKMIQES
jgi:hypothetical protein